MDIDIDVYIPSQLVSHFYHDNPHITLRVYKIPSLYILSLQDDPSPLHQTVMQNVNHVFYSHDSATKPKNKHNMKRY